jgi:hypothetical protein
MSEQSLSAKILYLAGLDSRPIWRDYKIFTFVECHQLDRLTWFFFTSKRGEFPVRLSEEGENCRGSLSLSMIFSHS